jgi:hypothetical protein
MLRPYEETSKEPTRRRRYERLTIAATARIIAFARGVLQLYCGPALGMVRGQPEGSRGIHMSRRYLLCVHFNMKAFD